MIWHSTNIRYLTSVFPSKLFSLALSLLFCIIDHDWHYPFPAALLQYLPFFFFSSKCIPHSGQAECHIFPVLLNFFLVCFARCQTSPWNPFNKYTHTELQTRFNFSIFCHVFLEVLFSKQAYNSPRSQPSS